MTLYVHSGTLVFITTAWWACRTALRLAEVNNGERLDVDEASIGVGLVWIVS
jgi:hypothetical protein